jgi:YHS domain-containing protein
MGEHTAETECGARGESLRMEAQSANPREETSMKSRISSRGSRILAVTMAAGLLLTASAEAGPQFVVALSGYDSVAYHTKSKDVAGQNEHTFHWNGAIWLFSSEANRDTFAANPGAYAPQYDGYCAYATANGYKALGSPAAWKVVDGRLYLNFNDREKELWIEDIPGQIAAADKNWPKLNAN